MNPDNGGTIIPPKRPKRYPRASGKGVGAIGATTNTNLGEHGALQSLSQGSFFAAQGAKGAPPSSREICLERTRMML